MVLACLVTLPVGLAAASSEEKVIGLVEIPGLFGTVDPKGPPGQTPPKVSRAIKLYAEPGEKAKVLAELSKSDDILTSEHGYEERSALVFGQSGNWFLVKTASLQGWLRPQDAGIFRSYETLIKNGLAYLNGNWDGRLYATPALSKNFKIDSAAKRGEEGGNPMDAARADVKLLQSKSVNGVLWFQVQQSEDRCEGKEKLGKTGWVPAYTSDGKLQFWFFSRGC